MARLSVTILGSGTSVPSPTRRAPAYLVRAGSTSVLLDCGSGSVSSTVRTGIGLDRLTGVVVTHHHPDHVADLVPLLFALANPAHPTRPEDLPIWGPEGLRRYLEQLEALYGRWVQPRSCDVVVSELEDRARFQVGPTHWTAFSVEHSGPCLSFRVEVAGAGSFCFSGDTGPCEALEQAARGVDLFICECSALEEDPLDGHMTASDVGRTAAAAGCGRVVLTHLYDHVERSDPASRVRERFSGGVIVGEDGMVLEV